MALKSLNKLPIYIQGGPNTQIEMQSYERRNASELLGIQEMWTGGQWG